MLAQTLGARARPRQAQLQIDLSNDSDDDDDTHSGSTSALLAQPPAPPPPWSAVRALSRLPPGDDSTGSNTGEGPRLLPPIKGGHSSDVSGGEPPPEQQPQPPPAVPPPQLPQPGVAQGRAPQPQLPGDPGDETAEGAPKRQPPGRSLAHQAQLAARLAANAAGAPPPRGGPAAGSRPGGSFSLWPLRQGAPVPPVVQQPSAQSSPPLEPPAAKRCRLIAKRAKLAELAGKRVVLVPSASPSPAGSPAAEPRRMEARAGAKPTRQPAAGRMVEHVDLVSDGEEGSGGGGGGSGGGSGGGDAAAGAKPASDGEEVSGCGGGGGGAGGGNSGSGGGGGGGSMAGRKRARESGVSSHPICIDVSGDDESSVAAVASGAPAAASPPPGLPAASCRHGLHGHHKGACCVDLSHESDDGGGGGGSGGGSGGAPGQNLRALPRAMTSEKPLQERLKARLGYVPPRGNMFTDPPRAAGSNPLAGAAAGPAAGPTSGSDHGAVEAAAAAAEEEEEGAEADGLKVVRHRAPSRRSGFLKMHSGLGFTSAGLQSLWTQYKNGASDIPLQLAQKLTADDDKARERFEPLLPCYRFALPGGQRPLTVDLDDNGLIRGRAPEAEAAGQEMGAAGADDDTDPDARKGAHTDAMDYPDLPDRPDFFEPSLTKNAFLNRIGGRKNSAGRLYSNAQQAVLWRHFRAGREEVLTLCQGPGTGGALEEQPPPPTPPGYRRSKPRLNPKSMAGGGGAAAPAEEAPLSPPRQHWGERLMAAAPAPGQQPAPQPEGSSAPEDRECVAHHHSQFSQKWKHWRAIHSGDKAALDIALYDMACVPGLYEWGVAAPGSTVITAFYAGSAGGGKSENHLRGRLSKEYAAGTRQLLYVKDEDIEALRHATLRGIKPKDLKEEHIKADLWWHLQLRGFTFYIRFLECPDKPEGGCPNAGKRRTNCPGCKDPLCIKKQLHQKFNYAACTRNNGEYRPLRVVDAAGVLRPFWELPITEAGLRLLNPRYQLAGAKRRRRD
ncbi:hypothetical protein HYH03_004379 [Edaphochlamys debaryana]|uniref:Uncharacterized protein n=1 Tax=Edaphochlamys debaryana TaxID=47281 RepID=A0A835Y7E4_9CHLO|nr:hypothetical protein HYH03_004379 [Edaphochlamys debaryana]|eukprot:KAG2497640.1 hypothetical protein HYH03_004379 [Edaphochlamys debaryana]